MFAVLSNTFSEELAPTDFYLSQNYPNPFREKTFIKYCIAYRTKVILKVYDSDGKEIEKLVDEDQNPGTYEVDFSTHSASGKQSFRPCLSDKQVVRNLEVGIYFYHLEAGNYKCEKQMIFLK